MKYEKTPLENLSPSELNHLSAYEHGFGEENLKNITSRFAEKTAAAQKGKSRRKLAIAVVAAATVALVGFTNLSRIEYLYNDYFGSGAYLAQHAQEIGVSATDQGIRMEVLSALSDGENTYLFIDLTDETGNRLKGDLFVDEWDLNGGRNLGGGNCRLVKYDEKTGVATLGVHAIGGRPGKEAAFVLSSFFTDEVEIDTTAEQIDLAQLLKESGGQFVPFDTFGGYGGGHGEEFKQDGRRLEDIKQTLAPDALHITVPGYDKGYISNIGYKDGLLHVQLNPDNVKGNEAVFVSLVNKQTGEVRDSYYSLNYGTKQEGDPLHGGDLEEATFKISQEELSDYTLRLEGWYYNTTIEGNWAVRFTVPEQMQTISKSGSFVFPTNGTALNASRVDVSPLSVTVFLDKAIQDSELSVDVLYQNGTQKSITSGMVLGQMDEEATVVTINGPITDFEELEAVIINGVKIPLR